jgi:ribosome maturation factor RimP
MNDALKYIVEPFLAPGQVLLDATEDIRGNFIRIIIDSEISLSLNDTSQITRSIRDSGEIDSRFPNGYRLEVSTPGLDYSLEYPFQYKKNIDRELKIIYTENGEDLKVTGKLINASEDSFDLEINEKKISLNYEQIKTANVKVSFK